MKRLFVVLPIVAVVALVIGGFMLLLRGCLAQYDERAKVGPAMAFSRKDRAVVVSVVSYEQCTSYSSKGGMTHKSVWQTLSLQANDPVTGAVVKTAELGSYRDLGGPVEVIGQTGDRLWLYAGDLVAFDPFELTKVADPARIAAKNPALAGQLPKERRFYALTPDGHSLRFIAKNGTPYLLDPVTLVARPLDGDAEAAVDRHETHSYDNALRIGAVVGERIFALLTDKERQRDSGGYFYDDRAYGDTARRRFYVSTKLSTDADSSSLKAKPFQPVGSSTRFLQGGLLLAPGSDKVLQLHDPDGFVVLTRQEIGREGHITVSRLDLDGQVRWTTPLAFADFSDYVLAGNRLVLFATDNKELSSGEANLLTSLDLATGRSAAYDFFSNEVRAPAVAPTTAP